MTVKIHEHQKQANNKIGKCWFQVLAIHSVSICGFTAATLFYWTSPSIPAILDSPVYNTNLDDASYLTVIPAVAMIIGSPIYSSLMDVLGRKFLILTTGVLQFTGWLLIAFSNSMAVLYISRFVYGLGDACLFAVVPIYIAEIATPAVRSSWGNVMMILIYLGQFLINAVGYYLDLKTTAFIFMAFPVIFLILFGLMPETPYYYLMKNMDHKALSSLKKLRQIENVDIEFMQIKQDVERQLSETGTFRDLFVNSVNRRAMLLCTIIRAIQQFSGISAFALYTQFIFGETVGNLDKGESAMIYTGMLAFCNIFGSIVLHKLDRKKAMIVSCTGCAIALFGEAVYFYFQQNSDIDMLRFGYVPIVGMCLYVIFFSIGLSIVPTTIVGEMFSASVKSKASLVLNILFAAFIGLSTKLFQMLTSNYDLSVPFALFGVCAFIGIFTSWYVVPETKGKTLEEIQEVLKK